MEMNFVIQVSADQETILRALTTTDGIEGWWSKQCEISDEVGGINTLHFIKEGQLIAMKFKVEVVEDHKVVWTCFENANPVWVDTTLTWDFENEEISFSHSGIDESWSGSPPFKATEEGWIHFMSSLKEYCETGKGQPW